MTPLKNTLRILSVSALTCLMAFPAYAEKSAISQHDHWAAYKYTEGGATVCYIASQPVKDVGDYKSRGDIFAMITQRPAKGIKNEFSYVAGYPYKSGSEVTVTIDGKSFTLFTQDGTAWAADADTDTRITNAIMSGSNMVVKGSSQRGTLTTDTFSLKGSGAAYKAASKACGM